MNAKLITKRTFLATSATALWGLATHAALAQPQSKDKRLRIGTFDSRAVAIASSMGGKPEDVARHLANLAGCWLDTNDIEAALIDGELAVRTYPDGAAGWRRLALAWYRWGDLEKAQANSAEAKRRDASLEDDPMTARGARLNRTLRLARTGDHTALAELVDAATKDPKIIFGTNDTRTAAIDLLNELIDQSPRDAELMVFRAQAGAARVSAMETTDLKEVLPWLEKALALEPDNGRALLVRGLFRIDVTGDRALTDAGYADLDRAIQLGAGTVEAYSSRAARAMRQEKFSEAAADYSTALGLKPDEPDLLRSRAAAYAHLQQWPKALADHSRLVELSPKESAALVNRADTYLDAGDFAHALADFDAALEVDPKNPDLFLGRAHAYRLQGKPDRALADDRQARVLDPQLPELAADSANAAEIEALRHDTQRTLRRALDAQKNAFEEVAKALTQRTRSEERLRRALAGDPRKPDEILAEVEKSEKDGIADATDYFDRGRALGALKRLDEALTAFDRAITLDDTNANARAIRGRIYESRKDYDHAFADYDRAVALAPENANFHRLRGDIWWERKDFAQALADYEDAVKFDPKNAENWFKRGNAKFQLNRFADAVADYDKTLELSPQNEGVKKIRAIAQRRAATP